MAEKLLAHALNGKNTSLNHLKIISAGVAAYEGGPASENAKKALSACNLDLSDHKSQSLTQDIVDQSLALFCMTKSHQDIIKKHFNTNGTAVHLVREFLDSAENNIPDPFGQSLPAYEAARDSIVEAIPSLIDFLQKIHSEQHSL